MKLSFIGFLFLVYSCKNAEKLAFVVTENILDTVYVQKTKYDIYMDADDIRIYLPRNNVLKTLSDFIDTLRIEEKLMHSDVSARMITKYSEMQHLILNNKHFEIMDVSDFDTLNKLDAYQKYLLIDKNAEIGFRYYFNDFLCLFAQEGKLSVYENDDFVDYILKKEHSVSSRFSAKSSIVFSTEHGNQICECAINRYQLR